MDAALMHIGIDFGTSNTAVAHVLDGKAQLIPLEDGEESIPTAVFYGSSDKDYVTGSRATKMYEAGEDGRLMRSIKSVLGTSLIDETTQLGMRRLPFRTVIADFLRHTIIIAEEQLGQEVDLVVQGRPVSFNDNDSAKDQRAQNILDASLRAAGANEVVFLEEPVAAAKSVTFPTGRENWFSLSIIGGGTSDFSVIRISDDNTKFDVLASTGVYIGGNDFDRLLSFYDLATLFGKEEILELNGLTAPTSIYSTLSDWKSLNKLYARDAQKVLTWMKLNSPNSEGIMALDHLIENQLAHKYAASTETMKIKLSDADSRHFSFQSPTGSRGKQVTRAHFEELITDPVAKMEATADECLKCAAVLDNQITDIVLVGGSTHIPFVAHKLSQRFVDASTSSNDRFSAVAKGLAVHGASLSR